jgi:porin
MRTTLHARVLAILVLWTGAGTAFAADLPPAPAPPPTPTPTSGAYSLNVLYTGEIWDNTYGGLRQGTSYMNNIDGAFSVDTGKAFGWTGGTFFAEAFYANGISTENGWVGAVNVQSPIDTGADVPMFRIYQLYYDQDFGKTDVRFGIYDLSTEFSLTKPQNLFLSGNLTWNTALDEAGLAPLGGTVGAGSYPATPLALRIRQDFGNGFSGQFALADGADADPKNPAANGVYFSPAYGALAIGEADWTPDKHTKLMVGAWGLSSLLPDFGEFNPDGSQRMSYGQFGGYVGGTARIYAQTPKRGLDAFFTLGVSSPQSTDVAQSFNSGLVYTGLFDARPTDKAGVSMNVNFAPDAWRRYEASLGDPIGYSELSFEATYRAKINDYLTVQPDVQYIARPGYSTTLKNPVVLGLHFEIGHVFEW